MPHFKSSKTMIPQQFFPNHPMVQQNKRSASWQNRTPEDGNEQCEILGEKLLFFSNLLGHFILDALKSWDLV